MDETLSHLIRLDDNRTFLINCSPNSAHSRSETISIEQIKAVFVSHCQFTYIGGLIELLQQEYNGPIVASHATANLLPTLFEEALQLNLLGQTIDASHLFARLNAQISVQNYKRWFSLPHITEKKFKLHPAGHMLGSSFIEMEDLEQAQKQIFSCVLGSSKNPLFPPPRSPFQTHSLTLACDVENQNHPSRSLRKKQLIDILERSLLNKQNLLIPSYPIGGLQHLIYEIEEAFAKLTHNKINSWTLGQKYSLMLDSPCSESFAKNYSALKTLWNTETRLKDHRRRHPLDFEAFTKITTEKQHQDSCALLAQKKRPWILVVSGIHTNNRRLRRYLDLCSNIKNTRILCIDQHSHKTVEKLSSMGLSSQIDKLPAYNSIADQADLLSFIQTMRIKPNDIKLVNGTLQTKIALKEQLESHFPDSIIELC